MNVQNADGYSPLLSVSQFQAVSDAETEKWSKLKEHHHRQSFDAVVDTKMFLPNPLRLLNAHRVERLK